MALDILQIFKDNVRYEENYMGDIKFHEISQLKFKIRLLLSETFRKSLFMNS